MECPRCGAVTGGAECPRCGVVIAKARAVPRPPSRSPAGTRRRETGAWRSLTLPGLGLVLLALVAAVHFRRETPTGGLSPAAAPTPATPAGLDGEREPGLDSIEMPVEAAPPIAVPEADTAELAGRARESDRAAARRLENRIGAGAPLGPDDLAAADALATRYGPPARSLLETVLLKTAQQERRARRYASALALLERARLAAPESVAALRGLLAVHGDLADWPGCESAARLLLAAVPNDADATRWLAISLVRQDRSPEAAEILTAYLDAHPDAEARALLGRIRRDEAAESTLGQQRLAHFHLRYDGAAHEDVGREVLRTLERHYATLTLTFDHQPREAIAVILLSEQSYYDSTGAPAWSSGLYDHFDGRVRLPIAGLTSSLTPDLDEALLHELTHVFVVDSSAGLAPRELNEGLAQYVAGQRSASLLGEEGLRALADGRLSGVPAFYLGALSFVEDLLAQRGQSGVNELLASMARTRNAGASFREVYGKDMRSLQADWFARIRSQYGG